MTTIHSTGVGAIIGAAALGVTLVTLMSGKEEIEWKDRSWNLLENKFQAEVDGFTYFEGLVGTLSAVALRVRGLVKVYWVEIWYSWWEI